MTPQSTSDTPSHDSAQTDRQSPAGDLIRAAAEDLRITGNKGQAPRGGEVHAQNKTSTAQLKRSLWTPDLTKTTPDAPPKADIASPEIVQLSPQSIENAKAAGTAQGEAPIPVRPNGRQSAAGDKTPADAVSPLSATAPYAGSPYYHGEPELEHGFLGPLHPLRILRVVRRKWAMMLLVQILVLAGAWFYLSIVPKVYRSTGLIEMSLRRPRFMDQKGAVIEDQGSSSAEEVFNTRLARFNGGEMQELALTRFKALHPLKGYSDDKLRSLMGMDTAMAPFSMLSKTRLVIVTCYHTDKALVPIIVNAFMEAAELYSLEENRAASDKAVAWLDAQARTQRDTLEKAEQAIAQFRMQNNIDVLENAKKSAEESAMSLGKSLVEREGEVILIQDIVRKIDSLEINPETAGGIPDSIPRQTEIKAALERWGAATTERDNLLIRYTTQHPEVIAQNQTISLLRNQVEEAIKLARATANANLDLLQKQTASLRDKNAELAGQIAQLHLKIVEANSRLTGLQRERDACDVAYRGILNRIEDARLAADENTATVKIVESAADPLSPFKPRVATVLLVAIFAGLTIGMGLALLTDTLEDRVGSTDDVERQIGLRILGLIPHVPRGMRADIVKANLTDKRGHIAEVFAGIRVLLNSRQYADRSRSVLVVSSGPEDGKTVTSCNLAIACAHGGMRTLLVDFDLRRPRIGRIFDIPDGARRLSEVLNAQDASLFPSLPQVTACENLYVVATRVTAHVNPSDIFGSGFVTDFVEWAQANYDRVIIDSAPFGAVSDCLVLGSLVGSVIVICRPVMTRKQTARLMVRHLTEVGANVIGAVINDVDFSKHPYFSNYHHDYHYSYTYGEHDTEAEEKTP